jgi:hypothetical protein
MPDPSDGVEVTDHFPLASVSMRAVPAPLPLIIEK